MTEPIEIEARPTGSTVVSFRLPWQEYERLEGAVSANGESLSAFIRQRLRVPQDGFCSQCGLQIRYNHENAVTLHEDSDDYGFHVSCYLSYCVQWGMLDTHISAALDNQRT